MCETKITRDKTTHEISLVQMKCRQRDACDARTKFYTDGRVCRDQGQGVNEEECITCAFGEESNDYFCEGKLVCPHKKGSNDRKLLVLV